MPCSIICLYDIVPSARLCGPATTAIKASTRPLFKSMSSQSASVFFSDFVSNPLLVDSQRNQIPDAVVFRNIVSYISAV